MRTGLLAALSTASFVGGIARAPAARAQQPARSAQQAIRARRESSNQAIAKHDTAGFGVILASDVIVVSSASSKANGREAAMAQIAGQFRTRPDVVYRRTPDSVSVFAPWGMASERGHWSGSWTDADAKISIGGSYFAKWRLIDGAWFVEAETYVPERCTGGTFCTKAP